MHITCVRHFSVHGDFARDPASLIEKEMARQDELKKEQREAARHKEQADMMQEREAEHTLWAYWRLADWSERLGMIGALIGVFFVGYLCAKTDFVSRLIDLIRSIKP